MVWQVFLWIVGDGEWSGLGPPVKLAAVGGAVAAPATGTVTRAAQ